MTPMTRSVLTSGNWHLSEKDPSILTSSCSGTLHSEDTAFSQPVKRHSILPKPEDPWERKTVLCLDGGGIRGYASLRILEHLMDLIASIELEYDNRPPSSSTSSSSSQISAVAQDLKPHHYFDYFFGTSTGGLSALLLGRVQLTVAEALARYDLVGNKVFARPRLRCWPKKVRMFGKLFRDRFDEEQLEQAIQEAIDQPLTAEAQRRGISKLSVPLHNENVHAAKSACVTWGGNSVHWKRLFRSYDHPSPTPELDEDISLHLEPHRASLAPIWAVARATSAAPTYFKAIKIGDEDYVDGALGSDCNNPIELSYNEVTQMHRKHKPALMLSIGTGTHNQHEEEQPGNSFRRYLQLAKQMQRNLTNSEDTHRKFRNGRLKDVNAALKCRGLDEIIYERLNPDGISSVKLDQWLPLKGDDAGSETKALMDNAVQVYLAQPEVLAAQQRVAKALVQKRRARAETEHWELFAHNVHYRCPLDGKCDNDSLFRSREELRQHAFYCHGFVWQINTKFLDKDDDRPYACIWDGCGQQQVPVFSHEEEFRDHLQIWHRHADPYIMSRHEFEAWLDDGRRLGERSTQGSRSSVTSQRKEPG